MHSVDAEHHEVLCLCPLLDLCMFSVSQCTHSLGSYDVKYFPKDTDKTVFSKQIQPLLLHSFTTSKVFKWETAIRKASDRLSGEFFVVCKIRQNRYWIDFEERTQKNSGSELRNDIIN